MRTSTVVWIVAALALAGVAAVFLVARSNRSEGPAARPAPTGDGPGGFKEILDGFAGLGRGFGDAARAVRGS